MIVLTADTLADLIAPEPRARAEPFVEPLNETMRRYAVDTFRRQSHFLAQVLHESGRLRFLEELWGPTPAQERYEGRADLGNTRPGDGFRFRGRGLIQLTGRANYEAYGRDTGIDYVADPDAVAALPAAVDVAGWFWRKRNLNALADLNDVYRVTRRINGGLNGIADRIALLRRARSALRRALVLESAPVLPPGPAAAPPVPPDTLGDG
ncbi:glycoside hydrolase family 19 protein [Rhodocaloribacter sp.]|jgi:putative chitinase